MLKFENVSLKYGSFLALDQVSLHADKGELVVLLAEQNAYAALKIAHRAYVLENGRIVREGKPAELLADDSIRKAYIGA